MTSKLKSTSKRSQRFPNRGVALWARFPPVKKNRVRIKKKPRARLFSPRVRIITVMLKWIINLEAIKIPLDLESSRRCPVLLNARVVTKLAEKTDIL